MQDAIPAATLILLRDRADGSPEIPMVGRGAHLAFAASRMVFPGGRIDPDDRLIAGRGDLFASAPDIDMDDLTARIAAIRETIEEIGLAPGMTGVTDAAMVEAMRAALHGGEPFSAIVERLDLRIDPLALYPFARWRPDHESARRFDTRFYIARAPEIGEASADGHESSHCLWADARTHLTGNLIFPTARNLERLAQARDFDEAVAFAARYPIEIVTPFIETRDGVEWLCIPDTLGYPVTAELLEEAERGNGPIRPATRRPG